MQEEALACHDLAPIYIYGLFFCFLIFIVGLNQAKF